MSDKPSEGRVYKTKNYKPGCGYRRATVPAQKIRTYEEMFGGKLKVTKSDRAGKRFKATYEKDGKIKTVHFGSKNGCAYIDHKDTKKRANWRSRHSEIKLKDGRYAYEVAGTPESFSYYLLW